MVAPRGCKANGVIGTLGGMGKVHRVHGRGTREMVDSIASVHLNLMAAYIVSYNHPLVNASELVNYLLWEPQRL